MTLLNAPHTWQFARRACSVSDCADKLPRLFKDLKRRTKQAGDAQLGLTCIKQDQHADVCFHPIDVQRASQCLIVALHAFPPADASAAAACFEIGRKEGCRRWMTWQAGNLTASWVLYLRDGASGELSWEQSAPEEDSSTEEEWSRPWQLAGGLLGIETWLRQTERDGFCMPDLIGEQVVRKQISSRWSSQILRDTRGFQVVVASRRKSHVSLTLAEADPAHVEELWHNAIAATTQAFGLPVRQLLNLNYNGKQTAISEQLNAASPWFHQVSYILHDKERDKCYRGMLQPLTLPAGVRRVFPAIALQRDEQSVLMINVVRTNEKCWLEFQAEESLPLFPWVQQTLGGEIEVSSGPAAGRWGW